MTAQKGRDTVEKASRLLKRIQIITYRVLVEIGILKMIPMMSQREAKMSSDNGRKAFVFTKWQILYSCEPVKPAQ